MQHDRVASNKFSFTAIEGIQSAPIRFRESVSVDREGPCSDNCALCLDCSNVEGQLGMFTMRLT